MILKYKEYIKEGRSYLEYKRLPNLLKDEIEKELDIKFIIDSFWAHKCELVYDNYELDIKMSNTESDSDKDYITLIFDVFNSKPNLEYVGGKSWEFVEEKDIPKVVKELKEIYIHYLNTIEINNFNI